MNTIIKYTPESVWEAMQENNRFLTEKLAEYWLQLKESERVMKEKQAETERVMDKRHAETERAIQELKESQTKTDKFVKQKTKSVNNLKLEMGGLGSSAGSFAEEYFFNCFKKGKRNFFGENFDEIKKNVPGGERNTEYDDEYDIVMYNCKSIGIVEVKFKARAFNIDDTIDKVRTFRAVYPEYVNHQIYLALAAMSFLNEVEDKCKEKGIAIVKPVGGKIIIYQENLTAF
jgi:hypothetical protein